MLWLWVRKTLDRLPEAAVNVDVGIASNGERSAEIAAFELRDRAGRG